MKIFSIVEDDADIRGLIQMIFRKEPEFVVVGEAESAEEALAVLKSLDVVLIVLDHGLTGVLTGLEAAPLFKELLPRVKIILFTADPTLQARAAAEPAIDQFLVKTEIQRLLPIARELCGIASPAA